MDVPWYFERLNIAPTDDRKAIRRAYAIELKKIDQAANPAAFEQLRQAYEQAQQWQPFFSDDEYEWNSPDTGDAAATDEAVDTKQPTPTALNITIDPIVFLNDDLETASPKTSTPIPSLDAIEPEPEPEPEPEQASHDLSDVPAFNPPLPPALPLPSAVQPPPLPSVQPDDALDVLHNHWYTHDPDELVEPLVQELKQRWLKGAAPKTVLVHILQRPVLESFECRDAFEQQVSALLLSMNYPFVWPAFKATSDVFGWAQEYRQVQRLGYASHWINQILDQNTLWHRQDNSKKKQQLADLQRLEKHSKINKHMARDVTPTIRVFVQQFPDLALLRIGRDKIDQVQSLTNNLQDYRSVGRWMNQHPVWFAIILVMLLKLISVVTDRLTEFSVPTSPSVTTSYANIGQLTDVVPTTLSQTTQTQHADQQSNAADAISPSVNIKALLVSKNKQAGIIVTPALCQAFDNYKEIWQARAQTYPRNMPYQPSLVGENIVNSCHWLKRKAQEKIDHPELHGTTPTSIAMAKMECGWIADLQHEFQVVDGLNANAELQAVFDQCTDNNPPAQTP